MLQRGEPGASGVSAAHLSEEPPWLAFRWRSGKMAKVDLPEVNTQPRPKTGGEKGRGEGKKVSHLYVSHDIVNRYL